MKRNDFSKGTTISDAWRKLGVPTANIAQATRWHDNEASIWTLWLDQPHGVNFEKLDGGETLVLTPWEVPESESPQRRTKAERYWSDLRRAAEAGRTIRVLAITWRKDENGKCVEEQHGATVPLYWRTMQAAVHEDGHRIVLKEASAPERVWLSSPAETFLHGMHRGATLRREPLAQGRRCMLDDREIPFREIRELETKGMIVAEKQDDGSTLYSITAAGQSRWTF